MSIMYFRLVHAWAFCVARSDCWAMRRPWCVGWATGKIPTLEPKSRIYIIDYQYTSNWSTMI